MSAIGRRKVDVEPRRAPMAFRCQRTAEMSTTWGSDSQSPQGLANPLGRAASQVQVREQGVELGAAKWPLCSSQLRTKLTHQGKFETASDVNPPLIVPGERSEYAQIDHTQDLRLTKQLIGFCSLLTSERNSSHRYATGHCFELNEMRISKGRLKIEVH